MKNKIKFGISLLSVCLVSCSVLFTSSVNAQFPGTNGKLYYTKYSGSYELVGCARSDVNGANEEILFNGRQDCGDPKLSPDGTMIAFKSIDSENFTETLHLADLTNETATTLITSEGDFHFTYSWAPDNSHLIVSESSSMFGSTSNIKKVLLSGTSQDIYSGTNLYSPVYTADGSKILMTGANDLFSITSTGQTFTNHTSSFAQAAYGVDSLPGTANTALFVGAPSSGNGMTAYSINLTNNTVSTLGAITTSQTSSGRISISPDGTKYHATSTYSSSTGFTADINGQNVASSPVIFANWGVATNLTANFDTVTDVEDEAPTQVIPGVPNTGTESGSKLAYLILPVLAVLLLTSILKIRSTRKA